MEKVICVTNVLSDATHSSLYFSKSYEPGHRDLDYTRLSERAWVCQERLLSQRNLHFTQDQLFWECRSTFTSKDLVPHSPRALMPAFLSGMGSESTQTRLHMWYFWILTKYTRSQLTFSKDRLVAISAVARVVQQYLQTPYLAGLWLEGLRYGLSWFRLGGVFKVERLKEYIAPSWSWASVNYAVNWRIQLPSYGYIRRVNIHDAAVDHDLDPFGRVTGDTCAPFTRPRSQIAHRTTSTYVWEQLPK
jgi:hypothetical protein